MLTTVVSRACLKALRARDARREVLVDQIPMPWSRPSTTRKTKPSTVLLTESTRGQLVRPEKVRLEPRGELPLKGKSDPGTAPCGRDPPRAFDAGREGAQGGGLTRRQ